MAPEMLQYHEGKTRDEPGLDAKTAWLPPTQGLRSRRTEMREPDVALFEALAGPLLSQLGYERAFPTISPRVSEIAAQREEEWKRGGASIARASQGASDLGGL